MTANEMLPAVGMTVSVRFEDIEVICTVRDVKTAYGRPRLQIEPTSGAGRQWVELARVRLASVDASLNRALSAAEVR